MASKLTEAFRATTTAAGAIFAAVVAMYGIEKGIFTDPHVVGKVDCQDGATIEVNGHSYQLTNEMKKAQLNPNTVYDFTLQVPNMEGETVAKAPKIAAFKIAN